MKLKLKSVQAKNQLLNFGLVLLVLAVLVVSVNLLYSYTMRQLYRESISQLDEVAGHLFEKLEIQLELQWDYLAKLEEDVSGVSAMTQQELASQLSHIEHDLAPVGKTIYLRAIDEDGCYYTNEGRQGLWTGIDKLNGADRQSFLIANWLDNKNYMAFVTTPNTELSIDGREIIYFVLLRSMEDMQPFFHISAYGNRNSVYVIDNSGTILSESGTQSETDFSGRNLFHGMRELTYPHMDSFDAVLEAGSNGDTVCTDVRIGDNRYYLVYNRITDYDWSVLMLVSSSDVAASATQMVDSLLQVFLVGVLMLVAAMVASFSLISRYHKNQKLLDLKEQNEIILKTSNQALQQSQLKTEAALETAKSATRAKSQFLANMSHDIRTPMNAIVGVATLMENCTEDPGKLRYYIKKLQHSSHYMLGLINDILDMSKIEAGEVRLNLEPIKLADQVGQIESIIRSQSNERGQTFSISVTDVSHEYLIGDSVRIRQVFINLLTNAVKYTQRGGNIRFDIRELPCDKPGHVKILTSVTDNGVGMSAEFLEHIFEPFTREVSSTTNKVQGTGLGMCIAKSIVDLMDGTISVKSAPGKGSRFDVVLTLEIDSEAARSTEVGSVLLISRDRELIDNVRAALRESAVVLHVCDDIQTALNQLRENPPETVLLDDVSDQTVRVLREAAKDAVLIFCCDYAHLEDLRQKIADSGVDGFVSRPFFYENLLVAVEQARDKGVVRKHENHSPLSGLRFLCAEDNELNAEILEALLTMHNASCTIYPNGAAIVEAFASVKPGDYDAILMDVQMPIMNGMQATRVIRDSENPLGKTIPIIAMTANAFDSDVRDCLNAGMNLHLAKPLDITALERAMQELLSDGTYPPRGQMFVRRRQ